MRRIAHILIVALIGLTFLASCQDITKLKEDSAKNTAFVVKLSSAIDQWKADALALEESIKLIKQDIEQAEPGKVLDALLASMTKMEDELNGLNSSVEKYTPIKDQAVAEIVKTNKVIQEAKTQEDLVAGLVAQYGHFIPPPYGTLVVLGGPLLFSLLRGQKHKTDAADNKAETVEVKRKAIAMTQNIDAIIRDPHMGESSPGKGDGAGKFDANDLKSAAKLKELDRAAGVTHLAAEAMV